MKKFDCFKFFNELELLHLRLMEYYDYVDYFVLVEATKSHTGKTKPLYYNDNKSKFKDFSDKIIHVIVEDLPDYSPENIWRAENFQRNCIMRGLSKASLGDKIFVSDCDELWDIDAAESAKNINAWIIFRQQLFYYHVNCLQNQLWDGSVMATFGTFSEPQHLRNASRRLGPAFYETKIVFPGGWHYSFMGGAEKIKTKVENIAESHLIKDKTGSIEEINNKIKNVQDLFNRTDDYAKKQYIELTYKPKKLDIFLNMYPDFIKIQI